MSLVQIAFLSFRLAGYFTANAGGGGGGAIPAKLYILLGGVGLRHPVIPRHVSFRVESIFPAWADLSHTGHAYSAVEKHSARAVVRKV